MVMLATRCECGRPMDADREVCESCEFDIDYWIAGRVVENRLMRVLDVWCVLLFVGLLMAAIVVLLGD